MKHRLLAAFLTIVVMFAALPSVLFCCAERDILATEAYFDGSFSLSGVKNVPGRGEMIYYAQNDALWKDFVYESRESKKSRPFGDGGCAPAAVGMAIAAMTEGEEITLIANGAKSPYSICPCSVTASKCRQHHARYTLTSVRDFERFLPLAIAEFAAGNNIYGVLSRTEDKGTATGFIHHLVKPYGLNVIIVSDYQTALDAMAQGCAVVAHSRAGSVFTNTGHYVFLAAADEERLYVMDSLCRESYDTTGASKLTVLEPGLVTLRHEDIRIAGFGSYIIFSKTQFSHTDEPFMDISESTLEEEPATDGESIE